MTTLAVILSIFLLLSWALFIWYVRTMVSRIVRMVQDTENIKEDVEVYLEQLKGVYETEMFYGDAPFSRS